MTRNSLAKLAVVSLICTLSCLAPASAKAGVLDGDRIAVEQGLPAHPHSDRRPRDDANAPTRRPANREPRNGQGKGPIPGRVRTSRARYGSRLDG